MVGPVTGELAPMRLAFGQALLELGRSDPDVVALTADVQTSNGHIAFNDPPADFNVEDPNPSSPTWPTGVRTSS